MMGHSDERLNENSSTIPISLTEEPNSKLTTCVRRII